MSDFSSYSLLTTVYGKIRARSPIRIGAGRGMGVVTSDLPVIKNAKEKPVIPGSSLKGFFRGHLQKLLLAKMGETEADRMLREIFGGVKDDDGASAILFHELEMKNGKVAERKHIAINPETGGVRNLFDVECVLEGAVFEGRILSARNLNPKALALLKPVLDLADLGLGRIGGFKSRGYGEVDIGFEELAFIFPGKDLGELKRGFEINDLIPDRFGSIRVQMSDGWINFEDFSFKAETRESKTYFGVEVMLRDGEVTRFLDTMLQLVKL